MAALLIFGIRRALKAAGPYGIVICAGNKNLVMIEKYRSAFDDCEYGFLSVYIVFEEVSFALII